MDGAGDAKGFRRVRLTNREGTHVPARGTARARAWSAESLWLLKKWKTPHSFTPSFIYPLVLGRLFWEWGHRGEADLALPKGLTARVGGCTVIVRAQIHIVLWGGERDGREAFLEEDIFEV